MKREKFKAKFIYLLLGKLDNPQLDKKEDNQVEGYRFSLIFSQIQNQYNSET